MKTANFQFGTKFCRRQK